MVLQNLLIFLLNHQLKVSGATRTIFGSGSTNGIGASVLPVNTLFFDPISVGDFFVSGDDKIQITGIQTGSVSYKIYHQLDS